ncbi:MAG: hypothetical protein V4708_11450 [Bacteroidota bacterium]
MHQNKRVLLDIKSNLSLVAHEFEFECIHLQTYLEDSIALLKQANYLSPDAKLYSIEADKYFWSVNHTFYFTSSFIAMLMQISEDLVNRCCEEWKIYLGGNLMIKTSTDPFYDKFRNSLLSKIQLDLKSPKWVELSELYQLRNALIHKNGKLSINEKPERILAVQSLIKKYHGLEIIDDQIIIEEHFCKEALMIVKRALTYLFKETSNHINILKRSY